LQFGIQKAEQAVFYDRVGRNWLQGIYLVKGQKRNNSEMVKQKERSIDDLLVERKQHNIKNAQSTTAPLSECGWRGCFFIAVATLVFRRVRFFGYLGEY